MDYGTLRVTTPDGQVREYPLNTTPADIGRADSNRVVIDHVSVSRRHARFTLEGDQVLVEDLGSASGTFVEGQQLDPETPHLVRLGDALRFGDARAIFLGSETEATSAPTAPTVSVEAASQPPVHRPPAPTDQAVVITLISPSAPVAAGATTTATCIVENHGGEPDQLLIEVQDLPEGWSRVTRPTIQLPPSGRDEIIITLQPPRSPEARAGEHAFAVAARSQLRGIEVRALGRLTILPFGGHSLELTPLRSTAAFNLKVTNDGNSPISLTLAAHDAESALALTVTPVAMELEPGHQLPATVRARTISGRFFGKERIFPFEVEAQGPLTKATAAGELRSRPPWLTLRWFALGAGVVAVAAGAFAGYQAVSGGDNSASPVAQATATPVSQSTAKPNGSAFANPSPTSTSLPTRAPTATTVPLPTNLPSVTPPSAQSRLGSGVTAQVISATNLTAEPSGTARVLQPLRVGERLIVVTNTPANGTFVITEGLIFWRVVIEGTQIVGWVPEVTATGSRRFLDVAR